MFSLLRLPNFAEPFVTGFALPNFSHLRVEIFELLALRVGWYFDGSLFRDQRDLVISVLVRGAVEHGTDSFTDSHLVCRLLLVKQNTVAVFRGAIGTSNHDVMDV